jgi:2-polyprenyl-3-methyl-5-hydroxy-6-metoxy-1,4-benzoquinol methylase
LSFYASKQYQIRTAAENVLDRVIYLEYLGEDRPGPQIDVGCSIGNFVNLDPARIEGVDVDRDALEICRQRGLRCSYLDATREEFPARDHYEVAYFRHVIEHLEDPLPVLIKLKGILKPGGLLVVETPDYPQASRRKVKNFWDDYTHKRPFTFNSLTRVATDAGFEIARAFRKPTCGMLERVALRARLVRYPALVALYGAVGRVDDLLFVLKRPA